MDIHISGRTKAQRGIDKLDGEFRVPLSYGRGTNKSILACCTHCDSPKSLGANTKGFICKKCSKYIGDIEAAKNRFEKLYAEGKLYNESSAHVQSDAAKEMVSVRETMQTRADLFAKGIKRKTVGSAQYHQILRKELKNRNVRPSQTFK